MQLITFFGESPGSRSSENNSNASGDEPGRYVKTGLSKRKIMHRTILLLALIVIALSVNVVVPIAAPTGIVRRNSTERPLTQRPSEADNPIKLNVSLASVRYGRN
jgi:hypothetical protein